MGVIEKAGRDDNHNRTPEDLSVYQLVEVGDLVVNEMKAWQGSLGISQLKGITSPDYAVFSPIHKQSPDFLNLALRDRQQADVYRSISTGSRPDQWRVEPEDFLNLPIFLPPIGEQVRVRQHIEDELPKDVRLSESLEKMITTLREYRQTLVSAAVTGQIDVTTEGQR